MHGGRGLGVELMGERSQTQVGPEHLTRHHRSTSWSIEKVLEFCDSLLLLDGSALLARILASHDVERIMRLSELTHPVGALVMNCSGTTNMMISCHCRSGRAIHRMPCFVFLDFQSCDNADDTGRAVG